MNFLTIFQMHCYNCHCCWLFVLSPRLAGLKRRSQNFHRWGDSPRRTYALTWTWLCPVCWFWSLKLCCVKVLPLLCPLHMSWKLLSRALNETVWGFILRIIILSVIAKNQSQKFQFITYFIEQIWKAKSLTSDISDSPWEKTSYSTSLKAFKTSKYMVCMGLVALLQKKIFVYIVPTFLYTKVLLILNCWGLYTL